MTDADAEMIAELEERLANLAARDRIVAIAVQQRDAARAEAERLREALESASSWLHRWGQHVGRCQDGIPCTCGLVAMRAETADALAQEQRDD